MVVVLYKIRKNRKEMAHGYAILRRCVFDAPKCWTATAS